MHKHKKTKVKLLVEVLSDHNWHLSDELAYKVGFRFGDAIYKARKQGYFIETDQVKVNGQGKYRLNTV